MPDHNAGQSISIPWAMQMKAVSIEDPSRLVQTLTGAILGCGGGGLQECGAEIASIDLEIQTFPVEMAQGSFARGSV